MVTLPSTHLRRLPRGSSRARFFSLTIWRGRRWRIARPGAATAWRLGVAGLISAGSLRGAEGDGAAGSEPLENPSVQPYRLPTTLVTAGWLEPAPQTDTGSLTVVSGEEIRASRVQSPRDLTGVTPNLTVFDANGDRVPRFSLRGIRENNFSVGEPAVSLYVDDVPYDDLYSRGVPLYDVDQVEFLRGPQGTLFGASHPAGVINILTRLPDNAYHASGTASYGNYDTQYYQGSARGPLVEDSLYLGVGGFYSSRDGYFHNTFRDTDPDTREGYGGRIQLRWTPGDRVDVTAAVTGHVFNDGYVAVRAFGEPGDLYDVSRDFDGYVDTETLTESLRAAYTADSFKVISVTTHRDWKQDLLQDFDFSSADLVRGFTNPDIGEWSQELRLQSLDDAGPWRWVAGGYFSYRDYEHDSGSIYTGIPLPGPPFFLPGPFTDRTTAQMDDYNYAAFGQLTYTFFEQLDVTGGVRFEYDDRSMDRQRSDGVGAVFGAPPIPDMSLEDEFSSVQPKLNVAYRVTPAFTAYGTVASGYQSGGFNVSNNDPALAQYDPADSWHFELGGKSTWFENRLAANLAGFYILTSDYQVYRPITSTSFYMANADGATSVGVELELVSRPVEGLELSARLAYVYAEFDEFVDPLNGADFSGKEINFVPQYTANLAAQYRFDFGVLARVEVVGVGEYYFDEANTVEQDPYALLNARVGWENRNFGVYVYGRNLLDEEYYANAINFRDPVFNQDFFVGTPGDPLTFGVEAMARF